MAESIGCAMLTNHSVTKSSHLLLLFVFTVFCVACAAPQSEQTAYPVFEVQTEIDDKIKEYEDQLQDVNLSESQRNTIENLLEEAQILATKVYAPTPNATELSNVLNTSQTAIANHHRPPTPTPELGLLSAGSIYYEINLPRRVLVENIWQGYVDDKLTRIYAGRLIPDSRTGDTEATYQGAVYVMILSGENIEHHLIATDVESGALTIIDVTDKGRVALESTGYQANTSKMYYLDVVSLQFVDSLDATVVPQPTIEAYP